MRYIVLAAAMAALIEAPCFAAFSSADAGTSTAQFLKIGVGARASGMGGAFAALTDDASAVYWNPAGLNRIEGRSLSLMSAIWFEGISYNWASYAQKWGDRGAFGIGVQYLSYGNITQTDENGIDVGSFSPSDLAASLSYGRDIMGVQIGVNLKYITSKITNTASAYALDIGGEYHFMEDKLWVAAVVQNMGTKMKFIDEEAPLPFNVKLGGAYSVNPNWKAALDVNAPVDDVMNIGLGTEYVMKLGESMSVAGRVGYTSVAKDTGGLNGASVGAGLSYMGYVVDYAFVPYGDLGNTQRISLSVKF